MKLKTTNRHVKRESAHRELIHVRWKIRLYNCHASKTALQTLASFCNKVIKFESDSNFDTSVYNLNAEQKNKNKQQSEINSEPGLKTTLGGLFSKNSLSYIVNKIASDTSY